MNARTLPPPLPNFFHYHAVFSKKSWEIIGFCPSPRTGIPPSGKSWIRCICVILQRCLAMAFSLFFVSYFRMSVPLTVRIRRLFLSYFKWDYSSYLLNHHGQLKEYTPIICLRKWYSSKLENCDSKIKPAPKGPPVSGMRSLHLSLSHPQPQPVEPQPNVFIVFNSLNKSTKRP